MGSLSDKLRRSGESREAQQALVADKLRELAEGEVVPVLQEANGIVASGAGEVTYHVHGLGRVSDAGPFLIAGLIWDKKPIPGMQYAEHTLGGMIQDCIYLVVTSGLSKFRLNSEAFFVRASGGREGGLGEINLPVESDHPDFREKLEERIARVIERGRFTETWDAANQFNKLLESRGLFCDFGGERKLPNGLY